MKRLDAKNGKLNEYTKFVLKLSKDLSQKFSVLWSVIRMNLEKPMIYI